MLCVCRNAHALVAELLRDCVNPYRTETPNPYEHTDAQKLQMPDEIRSCLFQTATVSFSRSLSLAFVHSLFL